MILNTHKLPSDYTLRGKFKHSFDEDSLFIITSKSTIYFLVKSKSFSSKLEHEPGIMIFQTEFPLAAASWITHAIEEKIWRSSKEGGLPAGKYHEKTIIEDEKLKIRRTMTASDSGEKGFVLTNLSKTDQTLGETEPQQIRLSDSLLRDDGLLDILKQIP